MFTGLTLFGIALPDWVIRMVLRLIEGSFILSILILITVCIWFYVDKKKNSKFFKDL